MEKNSQSRSFLGNKSFICFGVEWSQILCSLVGFTKTNHSTLSVTTHPFNCAGLWSFLKIFLVLNSTFLTFTILKSPEDPTRIGDSSVVNIIEVTNKLNNSDASIFSLCCVHLLEWLDAVYPWFWVWYKEEQFTQLTNTVISRSFRIERSWQTLQTQTKLLLEEQSDLGAVWSGSSLYAIAVAFFGQISPHYANMSADNTLRILMVLELTIFSSNFLFFSLFLPKTLIEGTRKSCLIEAVLSSTHNLCFRAIIRKDVYPCKPHFWYTKVGCKRVFITRPCYHNEWNGLFSNFIMFVQQSFLVSENFETLRVLQLGNETGLAVLAKWCARFVQIFKFNIIISTHDSYQSIKSSK